MPTALMGHREQVRANVKQQEKAATLTSGGPSLGDSACEDPPSASIIVVISSSQAACLDLPRLPLCLQPVEAAGKGHWGPATRLGASCSCLSLSLSLFSSPLSLAHQLFFSLSLSTATQLFVHLKPPDTRGPFIPPLSCAIQMFILTCGRGRSRVGRPRRCTGVFLISYSKRPSQLSTVNQHRHQNTSANVRIRIWGSPGPVNGFVSVFCAIIGAWISSFS